MGILKLFRGQKMMARILSNAKKQTLNKLYVIRSLSPHNSLNVVFKENHKKQRHDPRREIAKKEAWKNLN